MDGKGGERGAGRGGGEEGRGWIDLISSDFCVGLLAGGGWREGRGEVNRWFKQAASRAEGARSSSSQKELSRYGWLEEDCETEEQQEGRGREGEGWGGVAICPAGLVISFLSATLGVAVAAWSAAQQRAARSLPGARNLRSGGVCVCVCVCVRGPWHAVDLK